MALDQPLIVCNGGLLWILGELRVRWGSALRIGLFQNPWTPRHESTLVEVEPCTFSGYAGLLPIMGFGSPTLLGDVGSMVGSIVTWTHNGGPVANWVNGYYVVDTLGNLLWGERNSLTQLLDLAGQNYGVAPRFALTSRF